MENNDEMRLTQEKAFMLKEEFSYLTQSPFIDKDGKIYDWFEIIVAPYDPEIQQDFFIRYLMEMPISFDYTVLKHYDTKDYSVVARYGFKQGPTEFIRPLVEILRERGLPFNKEDYI